MYESEININDLENDVLAGFKAEGVTVQSISEHLFRSGVLVKLIIGRMRLKYAYDFKGLGIDFSKTNSNDFVKGHMENGKISILPIHLEKRLSSIEGALRNRQKRLATGFNEQFMPLNSYSEFKKDFEVTRQEFFLVRDEIIASWDNLIFDYKERLSTLLQDLNAIERDHLYNLMVSSIPTMEDYKNSFKMFMNVKTISKIDQDDDLSDEITEIISKDIVGIVYETVQGCIIKACTLANSAIKGYKNGEISIRTIGAIRTIAATLRTRNVVANNPKVEELAKLFDEAATLNDRDEIATLMEIVLAHGFMYAHNNNIPITLKPILPQTDLEKIYKLS